MRFGEEADFLQCEISIDKSDLKNVKMRHNKFVSLGNHFEDFVESRISTGRFKNASEVIRAGLRLLEEEEDRVEVLKNAIREGIDSGIASDFHPEIHLESLKADKQKYLTSE